MAISQKEAVYNAVKRVIGSAFKDGMDCRAWFKLHDKKLAEVVTAVTESFKTGETTIKVGQGDKMSNYIKGLIKNHLTKDKRLNGGEVYVPAKPGSNTGRGDELLRELKKAQKTVAADPAKAAAFQTAIDTRTAEIGKAKIEINVELLPEHLRKLIA